MAGRKQTQRSTSDSLWPTVTSESYIIAELRRYQSRLRNKAIDAWDGSNLQRFKQWIENTSFRADSYTTTRGQQIATTLQEWIYSAWGYQWLTAEPDPDVIVIDLRETIILGPIFQLFKLIVPQESRIVQTIGSYFQGMTVVNQVRTAPIRITSILLLSAALGGLLISVATTSVTPANGVGLLAVVAGGLYGLRDTRSWEELKESQTINAIRSLLEPPAPPEKASHNDDEATLVTDTNKHKSEPQDQ